jgi:hypothetical protein
MLYMQLLLGPLCGPFPCSFAINVEIRATFLAHLIFLVLILIMQVCFKKSFTTFKAYTNFFKGYVQCFELS